MNDLSSIDVDSWGKPSVEKVAKADTRSAKVKTRKTGRKTRKSKTKILTPSIVGDRIKASRSAICGEKAVKNWFFRHKALDSASLTYLIEIFRELHGEGYQ